SDDLQVSAIHTYADARISLEGDGMIGFTSHTVLDPRTGRTTTTTYDPTRMQLAGAARHPFRGLPTEVLTVINDGAHWHATRTRTTYLAKAWTPGTWSTVPIEIDTRTIETDRFDLSAFDSVTPDLLSVNMTAICDLDAAGKPITTACHLDDLGNITQSTSTTR